MIDYMEPGCVGLPKYSSEMGMSRAYSMGSPPCSIESATVMNHCVANNVHQRMQPRTSTSTTECILKEISSADSLYNYPCSGGQGYMTHIDGRISHGIATTAPSSKAMADLPIMPADCPIPPHEMRQILDFDNQAMSETQHISQFTKTDTNINEDTFNSVVGVKRENHINQGLTDSSLTNNPYLQASTINKKDLPFINNSTTNFNSATGEDLYVFPTTSNMSGCFEKISSPIPSSSSVSSGLDLKEEAAQIVPQCPSSSMVSPIDMEHQEVIKTERKRQRNRVAASKCRKRKLERISRLEDKVNSLKSQNLELSNSANNLRQQVAELKSKVMSHVRSGCQLMMGHHQQLSTYYDSTTVL